MTQKLVITKEKLSQFLGSSPLQYFTDRLVLADAVRTYELPDTIPLRLSPDYIPLTDNLLPYIDLNRQAAGKSYKYCILDKNFVEVITVEDLTDWVKPILDKFMPNRYYIKDKAIYLYYPEFTITNDIGESNVVRDLVVRVDTNEDKVVGIKGNRYTFSKEELQHKYRHSHLPTRSYDEFSDFCLGGGSYVKSFVDKLNISCNPDQFELLLAQLDQYLVWESRAGKPHISISKFYTTQDELTEPLLPTDKITELAYKFIERINPLWLTRTANTTWFFDPAVYETELWVIENEVVNQSYDEYCYNYDLSTNQYVGSSNDSNLYQLPELTEESKEVVKKFNITPRITENPVRFINTNLVRRLDKEDLSNIFNKINDLLEQAQYQNGTIEVTTQS